MDPAGGQPSPLPYDEPRPRTSRTRVVAGVAAGLVVVLIAFGALLWFSRSVEDASSAGEPLSLEELSERFVEIPGYTYRDPTASEERAFVESAGPEIGVVENSYRFRYLEKTGNQPIVVILLAVHPDVTRSDGYEADFAQGFAQGVSPDGGEAEQIEIDGETAYRGESQGFSWVTMVDEDEGVVVSLLGAPSQTERVADDFASDF